MRTEVVPARRVLIDNEGRRRIVDIQGLRDGSLQTRDASGRPRNFALSSIVAILPTPDDVAQPEVLWADLLNGDGQHDGTLWLTDGQAVPGHPDVRAGSEEKIEWIGSAGPLRGVRFSLPLERVAAVRLDTSSGNVRATELKKPRESIVGPPPSKDTVTFINADRAEGFVTRIGEVVSIEVNGKTSDYPATRVESVRLANPRGTLSGACVWLSNTAAIALGSPLATEEGQLSAPIRDASGTPTVTVNWNDIRGLTPDASRITPLAALKFRVTPDPTRRWSDPPRVADVSEAALGAADIELPGPMSVEWPLARAASRLSARIELPESCRRWGDADVVIEVAREGAPSREVSRERINGDRPTLDVNVELNAPAGATLRARLEPGANGPVQDRVLLKQAVLLHETK